MVHSSMLPKDSKRRRTSSSDCCLLSMPTKSFLSSKRKRNRSRSEDQRCLLIFYIEARYVLWNSSISIILSCMQKWCNRLYMFSKVTYVIQQFIHTFLDLNWVWIKRLAWSYLLNHKFLMSIHILNKGLMVLCWCSAPFGKHQQCNNNRITIKMFITRHWQMLIIILHKQHVELEIC